MKNIEFIVCKKVRISKLNIFLKKITGKEFKYNKKITNAPWKYSKEKKMKFFFAIFEKNIVAVVVIIDFKFSRHLSFLYVLKKFRRSNLATRLLKKYFLNTRKIKTIHVTKSLKKSLIFYKKFNFIVNYNSNNSVINRWILRCKKFDNKTFDNRYLLYSTKQSKQKSYQ
tara:strand:+ start:52 stop:558 length:507 start_codon:yes stop_codon:yes gene_type:complete